MINMGSAKQNCFLICEDYKEMKELKDAGVSIYRYKVNLGDLQGDETTGDMHVNTGQTKDISIIVNTNELAVPLTKAVLETGKPKLPCKRCQYITEQAQKLFQRNQKVGQGDITGICDHCRNYERSQRERTLRDEMIMKYFLNRNRRDIDEQFEAWYRPTRERSRGNEELKTILERRLKSADGKKGPERKSLRTRCFSEESLITSFPPLDDVDIPKNKYVFPQDVLSDREIRTAAVSSTELIIRFRERQRQHAEELRKKENGSQQKSYGHIKEISHKEEWRDIKPYVEKVAREKSVVKKTISVSETSRDQKDAHVIKTQRVDEETPMKEQISPRESTTQKRQIITRREPQTLKIEEKTTMPVAKTSKYQESKQEKETKSKLPQPSPPLKLEKIKVSGAVKSKDVKQLEKKDKTKDIKPQPLTKLPLPKAIKEKDVRVAELTKKAEESKSPAKEKSSKTPPEPLLTIPPKLEKRKVEKDLKELETDKKSTKPKLQDVEKPAESLGIKKDIKPPEKVKEVRQTEKIKETKLPERLKEVKPTEKIKEAKLPEKMKEIKPTEKIKEEKTTEKFKEVKPTEKIKEIKLPEKVKEVKLTDKNKEAKLPDQVKDVKPTEKYTKEKLAEKVKEVKPTEKITEEKLPEKVKAVKPTEKITEEKLPEKVKEVKPTEKTTKEKLPEKVKEVKPTEKVAKEKLPEKVKEVKTTEKITNEKLLEKVKEVKPTEKNKEGKLPEKVKEVKPTQKITEEKLPEKVKEVKPTEKIAKEKLPEKVKEVKTTEKITKEKLPEKVKEVKPTEKIMEEILPEKVKEVKPTEKMKEEKTTAKVKEANLLEKGEDLKPTLRAKKGKRIRSVEKEGTLKENESPPPKKRLKLSDFLPKYEKPPKTVEIKLKVPKGQRQKRPLNIKNVDLIPEGSLDFGPPPAVLEAQIKNMEELKKKMQAEQTTGEKLQRELKMNEVIMAAEREDTLKVALPKDKTRSTPPELPGNVLLDIKQEKKTTSKGNKPPPPKHQKNSELMSEGPSPEMIKAQIKNMDDLKKKLQSELTAGEKLQREVQMSEVIMEAERETLKFGLSTDKTRLAPAELPHRPGNVLFGVKEKPPPPKQKKKVDFEGESDFGPSPAMIEARIKTMEALKNKLQSELATGEKLQRELKMNEVIMETEKDTLTFSLPTAPKMESVPPELPPLPGNVLLGVKQKKIATKKDNKPPPPKPQRRVELIPEDISEFGPTPGMIEAQIRNMELVKQKLQSELTTTKNLHRELKMNEVIMATEIDTLRFALPPLPKTETVPPDLPPIPAKYILMELLQEPTVELKIFQSKLDIHAAKTNRKMNAHSEAILKHVMTNPHDKKTLRMITPIIVDSDNELDIESILKPEEKIEAWTRHAIKDTKIVRNHKDIYEEEKQPNEPKLFNEKFQNFPVPLDHKKDSLEASSDEKVDVNFDLSTCMSYALSDRSFIDKGWTMLPIEKMFRKMNIYRIRPAHPEFDWFKRNKHKGYMTYDTGEKLAEFEDDGRGRCYYKNGRLALNYYDAEETNAQQRYVIFSSGQPDSRGRSRPITVLAMFDYLGNGVVFDHSGKIRLKYNQTEGVVLDRTLGPVTHWKWHSLNDPPQLQQVMIDTHMTFKDADIVKLGNSIKSHKGRPEEDKRMLAIEFDNFVKEKTKKTSVQYHPYQIKMKALAINEQFSLKILNQASVYLQFHEGSTHMKLNLGMLLDHREIVDTETVEVGDVALSLEKFPARTDSIEELQRSLKNAQRIERVRTEREQRLRPPAPRTVESADQMAATASQPPHKSIICQPKRYTRKPATTCLYYNTRLF